MLCSLWRYPQTKMCINWEDYHTLTLLIIRLKLNAVSLSCSVFYFLFFHFIDRTKENFGNIIILIITWKWHNVTIELTLSAFLTCLTASTPQSLYYSIVIPYSGSMRQQKDRIIWPTKANSSFVISFFKNIHSPVVRRARWWKYSSFKTPFMSGRPKYSRKCWISVAGN